MLCDATRDGLTWVGLTGFPCSTPPLPTTSDKSNRIPDDRKRMTLLHAAREGIFPDGIGSLTPVEGKNSMLLFFEFLHRKQTCPNFRYLRFDML
jgi:hypothetical protein